ncbi:hypothetical protein QLX08_010163 [Tetragonisca angustula]|uniref:Uncharacterized protein n=1 Tax=Tetragonisca angustula TaxID=166442 RepID=A0AAW0ZD84_9HYME
MSSTVVFGCSVFAKLEFGVLTTAVDFSENNHREKNLHQTSFGYYSMFIIVLVENESLISGGFVKSTNCGDLIASRISSLSEFLYVFELSFSNSGFSSFDCHNFRGDTFKLSSVLLASMFVGVLFVR